jgi:hypothetical protein
MVQLIIDRLVISEACGRFARRGKQDSETSDWSAVKMDEGTEKMEAHIDI